tara:strand:+ start:528 stop:4916 length:4389 start_codon:yes stop_codon:yes gene_type:complete
MVIDVSRLKEKVSALMMRMFNGEESVEFTKEIDKLDKYVEVWSSDEKGQLPLCIHIPMLRTRNMEKGITFFWKQKTEELLDDLAGGFNTDEIDGGKSYNGERNKEKIAKVECKFELSNWRVLSEALSKHILLCQTALQQQHIWVEVGTNGESINRIGPGTEVFPEQDEFDTEDDEWMLVSVPKEEPKSKRLPNIESIADVITGSTDGKIFEREMKKFNDLILKLEDILEDPPGRAMKNFENDRPSSDLLNNYMSGEIESNKIEFLADDVDGAVLFTSLFSNKLKTDKLSKLSLEMLRCKHEDDKVVPSVNTKDFFSDLIRLYKLKDCSLNEMQEEIRKGLIDGEMFTNVISLLMCVAEKEPVPNHPEVRYNNYLERFKQRSSGEGTQKDVIRKRFENLTWQITEYKRDPKVVEKFYRMFHNYPFLAITGPGGVGKTALMEKIVWDAIHDPELDFENYLILTSKGDNQGKLTLLPGDHYKIVSKPTQKDRIAKYFATYPDFVRQVSLLNERYNPEEDYPNLSDLTDIAVDALTNSKILLVIDNFEDFEDKAESSEYKHFEEFFRKFNQSKKPNSKIILTTRGEGEFADERKKLEPLDMRDTVSLFEARIRWLMRTEDKKTGKPFYNNIDPRKLVELNTTLTQELLQYETDNEMIETIGHPATILLLAATLNDETASDPVSHFVEKIKGGGIGAGNEAFFRYCVIKSLNTQKRFSYLEELTYQLTNYHNFSFRVIQDLGYKITGEEISEHDAYEILDTLKRYSFIIETESNVLENFTWRSWPLSSLLHILGDKPINATLPQHVRTENQVENVIQEWVNKFIDVQNGRWEVKQKEDGVKISGRTQTVGRSENTSAAIKKIGNDLNKFTKRLLNWKDKNLLQLSFDLYESSASYVSNWSRLNIDISESQRLVFHSLNYMEQFNEYALDMQNEDYDGRSIASDLDWSSGIQIALTNSWEGLSKLNSDYQNSLDTDVSGQVIIEISGKKEKIISDFESVTEVLSSYRESAIIQANLLMKNIYRYKEFGERNWKNSDSESEKNVKIRDAERWLRIFNNLDTNNPQSITDLISDFATIHANLAIIHDDENRRIEHLNIAEEWASHLPGFIQHRIGLLKENQETGFYLKDELFKLSTRFGTIPCGTTICLDEDPESIGNLYQIIISTEVGGLSRKFTLIFENDPVNCNGEKYLADVIKSTSTNILTMRARRGRDGNLFKTRMPRDGKVDRNSLFLEVIIFDWAKNLLSNRPSIPRLEIESLAKSTLIGQTKFSSLDDLKKHLKITHPDLKNSNTTYFAHMIVAMASKTNDEQFFINNQHELCTKLIVPKANKIALAKPKHKSLYSGKGSGLCLPEDPKILAVLISKTYKYLKRNENCELTELRQVWLRECVDNNISKSKGRGLFYNFQALSQNDRFHSSYIKSERQIVDGFLKSMLARVNDDYLKLDSEKDKQIVCKDLNNYYEKMLELFE